MAVLNGSISTARSVHGREATAAARIAARTTYLRRFSARSVRGPSRRRRTPAARATSAVSSCKAPNGHSQPQNAPRPHTTRAPRTKSHRIVLIGSKRKNPQPCPARVACTSATTFTMESCPCAQNPTKTRANPRNAGGNQRRRFASLTSSEGRPRTHASDASATRSTAISAHRAFHTARKLRGSSGAGMSHFAGTRTSNGSSRVTFSANMPCALVIFSPSRIVAPGSSPAGAMTRNAFHESGVGPPGADPRGRDAPNPLPRAGRRPADVAQPAVEVEVAHLDVEPALAEDDSLRHRSAHVILVRNLPPPARGQEEDLIARVDARLQPGPGAVVEQVPAGGGDGRESCPDLHEGVAGPGRGRIRTRRRGSEKGALHLGVGDHEPLHESRALELREGMRLEQVCADACDEVRIARAGKAELRPRDAERGSEDRLVHDAQRRGPLGDAVEHNRPAALP